MLLLECGVGFLSFLALAASTNTSTDLIISYDGYYDVGTRLSLLQTLLSSFAVNVHHRPNSLSDFDVVEIPDSEEQEVKQSLQGSPRIRSLCRDKAVSSLLARKSPVHRPAEIQRVTHLLNAEQLWDMGLKGQGVKVAVFDTGLPQKHPHFRNVIERTDWTNERTADDGVGHGTFVSGVIAGSSNECPGFAPAAQLFIYKLFTRKQVSYTSWFLDAFNHAIMRGINIVNLSIGGPDFTDRPFIDKVCELTANGIILISAIGNDGPSFGTLNNPADQMDVIGVGGVTVDKKLARFSSRGMTMWELPGGYGRVKPDVVSFGAGVHGSALDGRCRALSGTSVASPVVAGAVALMLSGIEDRSLWNAGVVKQALLEGADRLPDSASLFEQGAGSFNLLKSYKFMRKYQPIISLFPPYVDGTECPYMWPFCSEPLYSGRLPLIINVTIINGLAVSGSIEEPPVWEPFTEEEGLRLAVAISYSRRVWPWSGYLALHLSVHSNSSSFEGTAAGRIRVTVVTNEYGERRVASTAFLLRVRIVPTPARSQRILWDQFRSIRYPPGYIPRDDLREKQNPLDWNGDHPHTNFRLFYQHLRADGFFIEILSEPATCVDLTVYSVYMLIDPEEEFFKEEIVAIRTAVNEKGLNLLVFAEWYNLQVMEKIKFFDENSKQWWTPATGGANVPALNDLLSPWGLELGSRIVEGRLAIAGARFALRSASTIIKAPEHALLSFAQLTDITDELLSGDVGQQKRVNVPIFALVRSNKSESGFVSLLTDSSCLDTRSESCVPLVDVLVDAAAYGIPVAFCNSLTTSGLKGNEESPRRSKNGEHLAALSNVVESYGEDGIPIHKAMPICYSFHEFPPSPLLNMSFPLDVTDKQANAFGRVVSLNSGPSLFEQMTREDMEQLGPVDWMNPALPNTISDQQPTRFYLFLSFVLFICIFFLMTKLCRWRAPKAAVRRITRIL